MSLVQMKDFDTLIENKPFFYQPVKDKQEPYEKLIEMSRNDDDTTGNLIDYFHQQNYYKLSDIDLSRQTNTIIPQQINFTGKLEEDNGVIIFSTVEKQQKKGYFKFFFKFINFNRIM